MRFEVLLTDDVVRDLEEIHAYISGHDGSLSAVHVLERLEELLKRDTKGLYARARKGGDPEFTGISSPPSAGKSATHPRHR